MGRSADPITPSSMFSYTSQEDHGKRSSHRVDGIEPAGRTATDPVAPSSIVSYAPQGSLGKESPRCLVTSVDDPEQHVCHYRIPHSVEHKMADPPSQGAAIVPFPQHIADTNRQCSCQADDVQDLSCSLAGTWHVYSKLKLQKDRVISGFVHKTRYFGPSHWAVSGVTLTLDTYNKSASLVRPEMIQSAIDAVHKCKALGKIIKARRAPAWPCPPTTDLPPKALADVLFQHYMQTFEAIQRVLHIPSFTKDYEDLYAGLRNDMGFIVQVKLVLAIGAVVYDDTFSLRMLATRWIYEAQCWMSEPKFKSRLALQGLQTQALLIVAHERVGIGGDPTFISAGSLLRKAMHMGLHKDPKHLPKKSLLSAEMRRRLWNTILEMNVQAGLTSGASPMLSSDDFDAESPGNYDDEQLSDDYAQPQPATVFTQSTVAAVVRDSFAIRLAVTKFLNDLRSQPTYDEVLKHDALLRSAYKKTIKTLQAAANATGHPDQYDFKIRAVELCFLRTQMALHAPYFSVSLQSSQLAFSRKAIVDCALKVWYIMTWKRRSSTTLNSTDSSASESSTLLYRAVTCSSGFLPTIAVHASHLLAVECRCLLEEQENMGPAVVRQDLLNVLEEAKKWCVDGLEAGKVSVRCFQLLYIIEAQIRALMDGLDAQETAERVISSAEKAALACLPTLERMAAELAASTEQTDPSPYQTDDFGQLDIMADWGYLAPGPTMLSGEPWMVADDSAVMTW